MRRYGVEVSPRGKTTREVRGVRLQLTDIRRRLVRTDGRHINPAFAVAEVVWILSGSSESWITDFNSSLYQYADNGRLHGAYGPRIRRWGGRIDQLDAVRRLLIDESTSRRAVIQVFDPARDLMDTKDIPCTVGYRFSIRDGKLDLRTTMRSQDAWLGLPYDLFLGTVLLELMSYWCGVSPGTYYHDVDSLHIYATDDSAVALTGEPHDATPCTPIRVPWESFTAELQRVILSEKVETASMSVLGAIMASYRSWKKGNEKQAMAMAQAINDPLGIELCEWYESLIARRNWDGS